MSLTFLTDADLCRNARFVAYATRTSGESLDHDELWIVDVRGASATPIAVDLPGAATALNWSPCADVLAVGVTIDGVRQIALVEVDGSWRPLTSTRRGVAGSFCWSPDGSELAAAILQDEAPTVLRQVAAMDGMGLVNDNVSDIHLIDATTGTSLPLTTGSALDRCPTFAPSGQRVLFSRSHDVDVAVFGEQPLLVDREGTVEPVPWAANANSTMAPTPAGDMVLVATRQSDRTRGVPASIYLETGDGDLDDRSAGLDLHLLLSTLGDQPSTIEDPRRFVGVHGDDAIVGVCRQGAAEVVRIALQGPIEATTILDGDRGCHPLALTGDTLLFVESSMHRPPTLRLFNLASGTESTVIDPNPTATASFSVRTLDVVSHGDPIQTWFLTPGDAAPSTPRPTVLIIHGGPYEAFGHTYYGDAHLLANAGYGVLMANPHGSIGYGANFATSIFGRPGFPDFDDLLAAVDCAIDVGLADSDRLAVCGLSYGGYMSAHLAARTDRFNAAVIENPMIDMTTFYATSDIGADLLDEMAQGRPDQVSDRYRDCSPLHYADQCRTPSLLILGEDDLRCPPSQGLQFRDALRRSGCPTEVSWLSNAAHADSAFGDPRVRTAQDRALLDWIQRYNPS